MLTKSVESYIAVRRATDSHSGPKESLLQSFAAFSDAAGQHYVSKETAIRVGWIGTVALSTSAPAWPGDSICAVHSREDPHHTRYRPRSTAVKHGRAPSRTSFPTDEIQRILQAASELGKRKYLSRAHLQKRSSPCWRVPGFACRKQSISVFQDITADGLVFAVRSS